MKRIIVSQRVDIHSDYDERRDALDQRWAKLLWELGFLCVPVPNHPGVASEIINLSPNGIILSGGNTPTAYGGNSAERDTVDEILIDYALNNNIPLLGVCRGMQSLVLHFGGTLKKVDNHIATRHKLDCGREANSFHAFSPDNLPDCFNMLALSENGEIEYIKHNTRPLYGVMWHPERELPFDTKDIELMNMLFGGQKQL